MPPRRCCATPTATATAEAPGCLPEQWRQAGRENARAALADFLNSVGNRPTARELASIEVPVVCSYGARSLDSMAQLVSSLSWAVPGASLHRIEGTGHAAPFDATAGFVELIADAVAAR